MPKILLFLCIISVGAFFIFWDITAPPNGKKSVRERVNTALKAAPNPSFIDIEGKSYNLHQFKGPTIILNFWATWCPPCVIEMPHLLELAKREQDNVIFIALSVDDDPKLIRRFVQKLPQDIQGILKQDNVIFGLDTDKSISKDMFGTIMYPETYIIDKDLMIKRKIRGVTDWLGADIKSQL